MVIHCTTKLPAPLLFSHFQCKGRLWFARQHCLRDFFNNAIPCHLRLLPWFHKKKEEADNMNAHHGQTLYDKASSSIAHLSLSKQRRKHETRMNILITMPGITHRFTSWNHTSRGGLRNLCLCIMFRRHLYAPITAYTTSSTTLFHAILDCCPSATQRK